VKVASLGSGSRGNSVYVEVEETRILVDAGFSGVQIERRLGGLGVPPDRIDAVVITHDHRDHTSGAGVAARRWGWPLYMSRATREACGDLLSGEEEVVTFEGSRPFELGALRVTPFLTCHDAVDPLAVTVHDPGRQLKLGVATDLGRPTGPVRAALSGCHFLILEANHDEVMLREGPYPWSVKQRIGGSRGHLSNRMAAELARELAHPGLSGILLAHLSQECNDPGRARERVGSAVREEGFGGVLEVVGQEGPSRLFDVPRLLRQVDAGPQMDLFRQAAGR
jgi:phosphoribosyl 1,2-cyclic phosphodiesterase